MRKIIAISLAIIFLNLAPVYSAQKKDLYIFHSPSCHWCIKVKQDIMPTIEQEFSAEYRFIYKDVSDVENYKFLVGLKEKYDPKFVIALPVFFSGGKLLSGPGLTRPKLLAFMQHSMQSSATAVEKVIPIDLTSNFRKIVPLAVIGAGLIDGINPCAFTVIVFFISFLMLQGYRRRELIIIGLCFILAVFLTYLTIGFGLFSFLYNLRSFWALIRWTNIVIGIFSILFGVLSVYDLFKFRASGSTDGMLLQLPASVKHQIHKVIGLHYRAGKDGQAIADKRLFKLIGSALITGFLVSILEAICTGQTYLPTIVFVFKGEGGLRLRALFYLITYNLMFILPLFIIFILALWGVTSGQFANFLKKRMLIVKALMAFIFFSLGLLLIWRA